MTRYSRTYSFDVEYAPKKEFGVEYTASSTPSSSFTRLGDAIGMSVNTGVNPHTSDFSTYMPWKAMQRYQIDAKGGILAHYNDSYYNDSDTAKGWAVVRVPKFFIKTELVGGKLRMWISPHRLVGYSPHPCFIRNSVEVDNIFISSYEGWVSSSVAYSAANKDVSGAACAISRANWNTATATGIGTGWQMIDYRMWNMLQWLFIIEYGPLYGTYGEQSINGFLSNCSSSGGARNYTGFTSKNGPTGYTDLGAGGSGYETYHSSSHQSWAYRGIENIYGNCHCMIDGLYVDGSKYVWIQEAGTLGDSSFDAAHGWRKYNVIYNSTGSSNYVTQLNEHSEYPAGLWMLIPEMTGGGANQYLCDYCQASTNVIPVLGGSYDNDWANGIFCWYVNTASATERSRIAFIPYGVA